jgi:hypothetical protein
MASMKFIATTSDKIKSISFAPGQMIFSQDDRVIYLDTTERISYQAILIVSTEAERVAIQSPVNGFYFVEETCVLWSCKNKTWVQLTVTPNEKIIFSDDMDLPETGNKNVLYVKDGIIYQWDEETKTYKNLIVLKWEEL